MGKISKFFGGIKKEAEKVRWPSKKDMVKYSITTILFIIFFALFFFSLDIVIAFFKCLVR